MCCCIYFLRDKLLFSSWQFEHNNCSQSTSQNNLSQNQGRSLKQVRVPQSFIWSTCIADFFPILSGNHFLHLLHWYSRFCLLFAHLYGLLDFCLASCIGFQNLDLILSQLLIRPKKADSVIVQAFLGFIAFFLISYILFIKYHIYILYNLWNHYIVQ